MKNKTKKSRYAPVYSALIGVSLWVLSGCSNSSPVNLPPPEPVETRTQIFTRKTNEKFTPNGYNCSFYQNRTFTVADFVTGAEWTFTADDSASCVAAGKQNIETHLLDRTANGPTADEANLSLMADPYVIIVGVGDDASAKIDDIYGNIQP